VTLESVTFIGFIVSIYLSVEIFECPYLDLLFFTVLLAFCHVFCLLCADDHRMNLLPKAIKRLPPDGCEHFLCKVNELQ